MDWIKELLAPLIEDEGKLNETLEAFKKEFPKYAVPKSEFNANNSELKETKSKLTETATLIEELKNKANLADEYKTKATDWETKYNEFQSQSEERVQTVLKRTAMKEVLMGKMPKSATELVLDKVDYSAVKLKDDRIENTEELLTSLKTNYGDLFLEEQSNSNQKNDNTNNKDNKPNDEALRRIMGLK